MLKFEKVKGGLSLSLYKKESRFSRSFCNAFLLVLALHVGAFCLFSIKRHPNLLNELVVVVPARVEIDLDTEPAHLKEEEGGSMLPHPLARQFPSTPLAVGEPLEKRDLALELVPLKPFPSLSSLDHFSVLPESFPLDITSRSSPIAINLSGNLNNYTLKSIPSLSLPAGCPLFSLFYEAKLDCRSGRLFSFSLIKSEDTAKLSSKLFSLLEKWLETLQFEPSSAEFIAEGTLEVRHD